MGDKMNSKLLHNLDFALDQPDCEGALVSLDQCLDCDDEQLMTMVFRHIQGDKQVCLWKYIHHDTVRNPYAGGWVVNGQCLLM